MNTEATATDEDYRLLASLMDFGSTSTSDPNWDWIPPSPRPIFFDTDAEAHAEPYISDVASELSDIVTDDLTRPIDRQNTLTTEWIKTLANVWQPERGYIFRANAPPSNVELNALTVYETTEWSVWSISNSKPPLFIDDLTGSISLQTRFMRESTEKKREFKQVWQAYRSRIEYLRREAELDGIIVNEESERDFRSFFRSMPVLRKAGVILMDNGNLRAVWRGEHKSRLGLQFLGDQSVEFVIFKRRQAAKEVSRAAGFDTLNGFKKQIHAFDLKTLVYT